MGSIIYEYEIPETVPVKPITPLTIPDRTNLEPSELHAGLMEAVACTSRFFDVFPFRDKQEGDHGELIDLRQYCGDDAEGLCRGAKSLGRGFMKELPKILAKRCFPSHQRKATGENISFSDLDNLLSLVGGDSVDFLMMPKVVIRQYCVLRRGLGGEALNESYELPSGVICPVYRGVPLIRNDFMVYGDSATVIAGRFENKNSDDGEGLIGINASIKYNITEQHKITEFTDEVNLTWNTGIITPSEPCLAMLYGVSNE